jgi:hypothetical protein
LTYAVQLDGSLKSGLDADQVQALVAQAFSVWQTASCPGGGSPSFQVAFQGFVSCDRQETVCGGAAKNVNVVMFHDADWPYESSKLGVTTPSGGVESGLVIDADVELNSQSVVLSSDPSNSDATALSSVLTHELGHFLGLAHSDVPGALMWRSYQPPPLGSQLLTADDAAAICAAYPPSAGLSCPQPTAPAYDACASSPDEAPKCTLSSKSHDSGCSLSGAAPERSVAPAALLAALLGAMLERRRRAR